MSDEGSSPKTGSRGQTPYPPVVPWSLVSRDPGFFTSIVMSIATVTTAATTLVRAKIQKWADVRKAQIEARTARLEIKAETERTQIREAAETERERIRQQSPPQPPAA